LIIWYSWNRIYKGHDAVDTAEPGEESNFTTKFGLILSEIPEN
jgi:hypothetical protein